MLTCSRNIRFITSVGVMENEEALNLCRQVELQDKTYLLTGAYLLYP